MPGRSSAFGPFSRGSSSSEQDVIDNLQLLGNPFVSQVGPKTYSEMLSLWEPYVVDGRQYAIRDSVSCRVYTGREIGACRGGLHPDLDTE